MAKKVNYVKAEIFREKQAGKEKEKIFTFTVQYIKI